MIKKFLRICWVPFQIDFEMCYSSVAKIQITGNSGVNESKKAKIIVFVASHIDINFTKINVYFFTLDHVYYSQNTFKPKPIKRKDGVDYIIFDGKNCFCILLNQRFPCENRFLLQEDIMDINQNAGKNKN